MNTLKQNEDDFIFKLMLTLEQYGEKIDPQYLCSSPAPLTHKDFKVLCYDCENENAAKKRT